ncbi:RRP15-like protein isoform X1 [Amphibalanus amphitrite]|uniref:RRP15-like protein isoform X1 n=2 Tax=Amphibalanus amphitrite TaxID=1232801 RepID=UPI001C925E3D|nr:RRP15-like protein isoform X1 [Amphibalanus amphitrite]XP_043196614.1 RRP15-like protein isoform X1 [Amphibalanus amphitrite]XP_043196615.1 RRP15-like protein isoform X1 [Amphibalanus amphitrite]XP_043196616.1 RRP15-like protein isoform X1 [Amphibalanus amphitrite]XP_043196617.1 RRP15-like protein isoform X1 [Amphibalanus amphitrite]XP_043196618.1 RRP15-like protein isoform X1 [Amphibalanus amphitrite]XP_043196619.1 RRP15-like protein isoform X1 [Amphibalanus amphitrite]XP_043196620.1 RRP
MVVEVGEHEQAMDSGAAHSEDASSDMEEVEDVATSAPAEGNEGWADVMSRLLSAPAPKKKYVILSKAKKALPKDDAEDEPEEEASDPGFDVEGAEAAPIEKKKRKTARSHAAKRKELVEKRKKLREWEMMGRKKPDIREKDRERTLCKIATRGVVQLFNAVRKQQAEVQSQLKEAGGSLRKTEKALKAVSKQTFMDRLRDGADAEPAEQSAESGDRATWSVLRDDYLPEAGHKDWDQDSDAQEDSGSAGDSDDDL